MYSCVDESCVKLFSLNAVDVASSGLAPVLRPGGYGPALFLVFYGSHSSRSEPESAGFQSTVGSGSVLETA